MAVFSSSNAVVRQKPDVAPPWRELERVEDAICRETLEETGLTIRFLRLTQMIGQDGRHWISPVWLAEVEGGKADNLEPDKSDAIAWFPLDAPPAPLAQAAGEAIAIWPQNNNKHIACVYSAAGADWKWRRKALESHETRLKMAPPGCPAREAIAERAERR